MELNIFKGTNIRKAFFLILFLVFLLLGLEIFAAACNKPPAWNKAGTCTVDIYYEDPSGGSDLDGCYYTTESGISPSCPTNGSWSSACNCSGLSATTCPVTISIGSTGDCNTNGEGACKICSKATDGAGNTGYGELSLNVDYTSSGTTIECNGTICSAGWYNADISITLFCSDSDSGCDETYYCIDQTNSCSPGTLYIGAFNLTAEGTNYVRYYSTDVAGNVEPTNSKTIKLDKTGPISQFTDVATPPAGSTMTTDFDVSVDNWDRPLGTAGVDNSGLASCYYSVYDSGVGWTKSGETRNCSSDLSFTVTVSPTGDCRTIGGTCTVSVYAYDAAGNPGDGQSRTFNIASADTTPPYRVSWDPLSRDCTNANTDIIVTVEYADEDQVGCTGYLSGGFCWYHGDFNQSCNDVCSSHGGPQVEGDCDQDDIGCEACRYWHPGAYCANGRFNGPCWDTVSANCHTGVDYSRACDYIRDTDQTQIICACRGDFTPSSGMAETKYCWTEGASCTPDTIFTNGGTISQPNTGNWTLCVKATDNASPPNSITECEGTYIVDKQLPDLPTFNPTLRDWSNEDVSVTVTYTDNLCDISYTRHCWTIEASCEPGTIEENTFVNGTSITKSENGSWTLCARARDGVGNWRGTDCSTPYQIDKEEPMGTLTISPTIVEPDQEFTVSITAEDELSKVDWIHLYREGLLYDSYSCGGISPCLKPWSISESNTGEYTYCGLIYDLAGNLNLTTPPCIAITVTAENQPPVCGISVPPITTVSAPIYIEVGGSYDPEGAIAKVRFCSDKNPANPNDQCDESWTRNYDWDIPEEDWDAVNQKMKWSFGETGTYEVWVEVEDSVGQPDSCYDTIAVTDCLPGVDTKNCTSGFGCEHTLTCTAEGTWPADCGPSDECTLGSILEGCGVSGDGIQTCTDSCTWGVCIEPDGCPWPPPSCPICQHPECLVPPSWSCQPDPAGTDCGDCLLCNDSGECNVSLCAWTPDSCECIPGTPDSCWDCNNYGTECGYQGVCSCGLLETPNWTCDEGVCQCTCNLDLITCAEPPPGCQEDYPGVAITPTRYAIAAGTPVTYTVFVVNRDEGQDCPDATFNLTTGGHCNEPEWSCVLGVSELIDIPPGQSAETTLTVTSPEPYSRGDYEISVTATRQ